MLAVLVAVPLAGAWFGLPIRLLVPEGRLADAATEPAARKPGSGRRRFARVAVVAGLGVSLAVGVSLWQRQAAVSPGQAPAEAAPGQDAGPLRNTPAPAPEEIRDPAPAATSLPAEAGPVESEAGPPAETGRPPVRVSVDSEGTAAGFTVYRFGGGLDKAQFMPVAVDGPDVWVGTGSGLLRYRPGEDFAELFNADTGLPGERITALAVDGGRVAFDLARMTGPHASAGLGVFRMDPARPRWRRVLGGAWDLRWDGAVLWAALGGELDARGEPGGPIRRYLPEADGPRHGSVACLAVSPAEVWCGMFGDYDRTAENFQGGGVSRLDRRTGAWTHYTTADGLARDYTCSLAADGREVWAAHWDEARGLSRFDRASGRWSAVPRAAGGEEVGGTRLALDGPAVWIGQQGGLVRLDRAGLQGHRVSGGRRTARLHRRRDRRRPGRRLGQRLRLRRAGRGSLRRPGAASALNPYFAILRGRRTPRPPAAEHDIDSSPRVEADAGYAGRRGGRAGDAGYGSSGTLFRISPSTLHGPGPWAEMNRKTKQYSTASSPPLSSGKKALVPWAHQ